MRRTTKAASILLLVAYATGAAASETITYSYDAKGRVIQVMHSGTVNSNVQTTYTHDLADNRTHVAVTGSTNGSN